MTLYRDDIQETIAYSNNTIGKSKAVTEELIRIKEDALYRLAVLSGDVVLITDELVDSAIFPVKDEVNVTDHFTGRKRHVDFIHDQIIVSDGFKNRLRAKSLIQDNISSTSTQKDTQRNINIERLFITEKLNSKKYSLSKLNEALKIKENFKVIARFKDSINDDLDILDASLKYKFINRSCSLDSISLLFVNIAISNNRANFSSNSNSTLPSKLTLSPIIGL